jgi:Mlc titration factor MtfA (ptsG expression regulator)
VPDDWRDIAAARVAHWSTLDDDERERLGELAEELLVDKRWEAAQGFELTDEVRVVIAAQAAVLGLGLDFDCFHAVTLVIVHPTVVTRHGEWSGPAPGVVTAGPRQSVGQAHPRSGPVLISWDQARASAGRLGDGYNVVLHEFAHKIDMLDDLVDGTPPIPDPAARQRWIDVCTAEYLRLRAGETGGPLRDYAAVTPAEFFAVATEVFFDLPHRLRDERPELYEVLRDFYNQDPARRIPEPS